MKTITIKNKDVEILEINYPTRLIEHNDTLNLSINTIFLKDILFEIKNTKDFRDKLLMEK